MKHLDKIMELAENELAAIVGNGKFRTREEIDSVYKLIDIGKDITCIWKDEMEMEEDDEYSRYDGHSYARGRRNARRDSMGRYSRDGYDRDNYEFNRSMRGYSRADSKEEYKNNLRMLMDDAPDEATRQNIKRMIEAM